MKALALFPFLLLIGCSTGSSDFSCRSLATDNCLSIEEVDAMTRYADGASQAPKYSGAGERKQFSLAQEIV